MHTPFDRTWNAVRNSLISEWRGGWKLWSVQINALGLALMAFGELVRDGVTFVPPVLMARLPHAEAIGMFLFALGMASRFLRQQPKAAK